MVRMGASPLRLFLRNSNGPHRHLYVLHRSHRHSQTARNHHPPENHHLPESLLPENHQLPESLLQLQPRYSHHHHHAAQRPHKHKPTTRHHLPLPGLQADSPTGPLRPLHVPPYHPLQNQQYLPQHVQPYRHLHAQQSLHVVLPRLRVRPPIIHLAVRLLPLSHLLLQMVLHHRRRLLLLLLRRLRWEVVRRSHWLMAIRAFHRLRWLLSPLHSLVEGIC